MDRDREQPLQDEERSEDVVMPVVEEEVVAGTVPVKTGSVRIDKHVEKRIRRIETPLVHEEVEVRRIPMNRVVTEVPVTRKRGDTVIIPVVEEQVVVTKNLVLKEEIHLIKHRTRDYFVKEVELDRESAEVHRLDSAGRVIDSPPRTTRPARRRSLLS